MTSTAAKRSSVWTNRGRVRTVPRHCPPCLPRGGCSPRARQAARPPPAIQCGRLPLLMLICSLQLRPKLLPRLLYVHCLPLIVSFDALVRLPGEEIAPCSIFQAPARSAPLCSNGGMCEHTAERGSALGRGQSCAPCLYLSSYLQVCKSAPFVATLNLGFQPRAANFHLSSHPPLSCSCWSPAPHGLGLQTVPHAVKRLCALPIIYIVMTKLNGKDKTYMTARFRAILMGFDSASRCFLRAFLHLPRARIASRQRSIFATVARRSSWLSLAYARPAA